MENQEFFERYIISHGEDELIRNTTPNPTVTAFWEKWHENRMMCIEMAMEELTPKQRSVVRLIFLEKVSPSNAAKKLNINKKNITDIKRRAIKTFKHNLLLKFFIKTKD